MLKGLLKRPTVTLLCLCLTVSSVLLFALGRAVSESDRVTVLPRETLELAVLRGDSEGLPKSYLNGIPDPTGELAEAYEMDIRAFGAAYVPGLKLAHTVETEKYSLSSTPAALVIYIATCRGVEQTYDERVKYYTLKYTLEVDEIVYQNEVNRVKPQKVQYSETVKDTSMMLEVGKRYLVWGDCSEDMGGTFLCPVRKSATGQGGMLTLAQEGTHWIVERTLGARDYVPILSEIHEPIEVFLKSEAGEYWQKAIFSKIEVCESMVGIMGTDRLESLPAWNTAECKLIEGAVFTAAQYENGDRVCLISEEIARLNGLSVGDRLPLKLFAAGVIYELNRSITYQATFDPYAGFLEEENWQIVGIYATEYDKESDHDIHPNTVLIPKQAVRDYPAVSDPISIYRPGSANANALSVILPENGWVAFEVKAVSLDFDGWFEYNNGILPEEKAAYEAHVEALRTWQEKTANAAKLLSLISAALAIAAMMIFAFSKEGEIEQIYAIETPYRRLFFHVLVRSVSMGAVGLFLSIGIGFLAVPPLARALLMRMADAAYAADWLSRIAFVSTMEAATLVRPALILFGAAILFAAIASRREYHFEYHEEEHL